MRMASSHQETNLTWPTWCNGRFHHYRRDGKNSCDEDHPLPAWPHEQHQLRQRVIETQTACTRYTPCTAYSSEFRHSACRLDQP